MNLRSIVGTGILTTTLVAGAMTALGLSRMNAPVEPAVLTAAVAATGTGIENLDANEVHTFKVDKVHSTVVFRIMHMGVAPFYGRFNSIDGTFTIDRDDPSASSVSFEIDAESVDTNNSGRDRHLKGPDFFDAKQFPKITFTSTEISRAGEDQWNVTGDLTLHGVTKTMTVPVEITGMRDTGRQGFKGGLGAQFTIKRSDFGMTTYVAEGGLGDEVTIMVGIEGAKQ